MGTVGKQRIVIIAVITIAAALFGMALGASVIVGSLMKETHIQQGHVLTAGDGNVVEASEAVQDVPLYYLPFMDVHLLASTMGENIMYKWNGDTVYEIVRMVSKPEEAKLLVDGQETKLCGDITCSKASLTLEEDL